MGISIALNRKPYQLIENVAQSKLVVLQNIFGAYRGYFEATQIELWQYGARKALGGKMVAELSVKEPSSVTNEIAQMWERYHKNWQLLETMILRIKGGWNIDNLIMPGLIALNCQEEWAKSYGDIEVTSYRKGNIEDFIDLFWHQEDTARAFVNGLMDNFGSYEDASHVLSTIIVGEGAPFTQPVTEWLSSYH